MNVSLELLPTRQSLLSRLKDRKDENSWKVFFDTYWKFIYNVGIKSGLSQHEAQDVVQETVISVIKAMPSFSYDPANGSFKQWLLQLTSWRVRDQLRRRPADFQREGERKQNRETRTSSRTDTIHRVADPVSLASEESWDKEWEENLMEA